MRRLLTTCLLALAVGLATPAWARNYALLIGNSNYAVGPLENPVNDARDLANVLRSIGFDTTVKLDADSEGMKGLIRDFAEKVKNNDGIALFFYAGHGVQVKGENYLIPVGYPFRSEADVEKLAVPANMVLRYMEDAKNRVNLMVLDACRDNPFIKTRSLKSRGLAPMDAPSGSLVAFSTAPGTEASDGSGRNGLYTKHLMANIRVPGLTVEQVFKRTREDVENESAREMGQKQSPREESSLKGGDMYFVPPLAKDSTADPAAVELAYWNSIANSDNPADFEAYLTQYPTGRFSELAKNRLAASRGKSAGVAQARAVGEESSGIMGGSMPTANGAMAKSGSVVGSSRNGFSFSEGEGTIKAAEFLSISCRDFVRNKRVRVEVTDKSRSGAPFRQALLQRLQAIGVKVAAAGGAADVVVKGVIETSAGVNSTLGINEVDLDAEFSLQTPAGKTLSTTSVSGGAYAGRDIKNAARDAWDEKSEEVVGKLFQDYCGGR